MKIKIGNIIWCHSKVATGSKFDVAQDLVRIKVYITGAPSAYLLVLQLLLTLLIFDSQSYCFYYIKRPNNWWWMYFSLASLIWIIFSLFSKPCPKPLLAFNEWTIIALRITPRATVAMMHSHWQNIFMACLTLTFVYIYITCIYKYEASQVKVWHCGMRRCNSLSNRYPS